jgi:hypothetical protein
MDRIGWFIATSHLLLGHDKAAAFLGVPLGDRSTCLLCQYEDNPTPARRQAVIDAIGRGLDHEPHRSDLTTKDETP